MLSAILTHKELETRECIINIAANVILVLIYRAISINSADWISIAVDNFDTSISHS